MLKKALYFIIFALITTISYASEVAPAPTYYQVELIIFQHKQGDAAPNAIVSNADSSLHDFNNAIQLTPVNTPTINPAYQQLPRRDFTLKKEDWALNHKENYTVLAHLAWLQPDNNTSFSKPVQINNDDGNWQVNGIVKISKRRYYRINTNLTLTPLNDNIELKDDLQNNDISYHLVQSQRMRSNELHYLDNPMFGVLVKITPINKAA